MITQKETERRRRVVNARGRRKVSGRRRDMVFLLGVRCLNGNLMGTVKGKVTKKDRRKRKGEGRESMSKYYLKRNVWGSTS